MCPDARSAMHSAVHSPMPGSVSSCSISHRGWLKAPGRSARSRRRARRRGWPSPAPPACPLRPERVRSRPRAPRPSEMCASARRRSGRRSARRTSGRAPEQRARAAQRDLLADDDPYRRLEAVPGARDAQPRARATSGPSSASSRSAAMSPADGLSSPKMRRVRATSSISELYVGSAPAPAGAAGRRSLTSIMPGWPQAVIVRRYVAP